MKVRKSTLINRLEKVRLENGDQKFDIYHDVKIFDPTIDMWRRVCAITRQNIIDIAYCEGVVESEALANYEHEQAHFAFDVTYPLLRELQGLNEEE